MRNVVAAVALLLASLGAPALADEQPIDLKKAPGRDVVEGNCAACHSLDYIEMNSPFLNAAGWDAEINKMIKLFGAPISEADAKTIGDYLKANYGG
jgi:sulfite dehydrogenase (cytochrome) subunit B